MTDPLESLPRTRREAKQKGEKFYYTGVSCVRGHRSKRYTSIGTCAVCSSEKKKEWEAAHPERKADSRRRYRKRHKEGIAARRASWRKVNKKVLAEKAKAYYEKNREAIIEKSRAWYRENLDEAKETYKKWKEAHPGYHEEWRRENIGRLKVESQKKYASGDGAAYRVAYRRQKRKGTFASQTLRQQVDEVKIMCQRLTILTGVVHHVDHVIPVVSDSVCGLNVPWNLRVVTASANLTKGDQMPTLVEVFVKEETASELSDKLQIESSHA